MPSLKFDITGDNKNVLDSFNGVQQGVRRMQHEVEHSGQSIESMFNRIQYAATASLAGFSVKEFVQKVAQVRGEFQQLEVAFTTMLGSAGKANELMQQLTRTAARTPFDLQSVANGAKQLMAYGVAADQVNDTLVHLGDIAAGLSIPLNDLVMLYGTTMTQGRMFTQDLRQFMGRGIPLADELAKQFGVTKDKVGELVTAGKVGAEEFNKAIMSMSSEGGKFAGLMEAQSETISGQISNIEDAIDVMFNNIGKSNEGIINDVLGSVSSLVENYEKVGEVLMGAVIAIGTYKTALITANAIEKASISIKQAIAVQEELLAAEARNLAAARGISIAAAKAELGSVNVLTVAKMRLTAATKALTASMMANPYTAVAAALAVVAVGVYKLATAEGVETAARRKANEEMQTFADKLDEQQNKIKGYIQTIQDETATEYQKAVAWEMLNKMAPTLTEKYDKAAMATLDLAEATKELNEQADEANYEHIRDEVQKWKETIDRIKQNMLNDARYTGGKNAIFNLMQLEDAETQLDQYLKKLVEIERIRKKIAEDNKPLEIRIKEANENVQAKQEIYDFYKRAADLAGELKNAHDEAAGVIANSGIPYNYEAIADQTKEKYDALIAELEADVEDLRTRIAESPASLELEQELKGKEKALNDLIAMKQQWALSGVTTIPFQFTLNFSQVETALQNAKNGQGINTQGMRFNGPTGTWVKDEATAPETHTAAQWRRDAYNNWKHAQTAVDAFWQKKESMDKATFDKQFKELKDAADQAKKDYDKLKGNSGSKEVAERAKKMQEYLDLIEKQRVEQERAVRDLELSTSQAQIDIMEEGSNKTLAQIRLDFEKQKEEIERGYADLKQKKIDEARQLFEANPANKGKAFDESTVNTEYTEAEKKNYETLLTANEKTRNDALEDEQKTRFQYLYDYIKEYGSIQGQKAAITKEYEQKIADESDVIRRAALEQERDGMLKELNFKEIQDSLDWERVFDDLSHYSTEALRELKTKLRSALDAKDITAENAKVISDKIIEIENRISEKSDVWASIIPGLKERKRLTEQTLEAEQKYQEMLSRQYEAENKTQDARNEIVRVISEQTNNSAGSISQQWGNFTADDIKDMLGFYGIEEASSELQDAMNRLTVATTNEAKAKDNTQKAKKTSTDLNSMLNGSTGISDYFKAVTGGSAGGAIQFALNNGASLKEFVDTIGLANTDFGEAVGHFSEGCEGFQSAISSFAQGDVVGGVTGIIKGVQGWGKTIEDIFGGGKSSDENYAEDMARLSSSNERLKESIDRLSEKITSENTFTDIEKAYELQKEAYEKQAKNTSEQIRRTMDLYTEGSLFKRSSDSTADLMYQRLTKSERDQISSIAGRPIKNRDDLSKALSGLSPEQMKELRDIPALWNRIIELADDGEGNAVKYLKEMADIGEQMAEMESRHIDALTHVSFDNLRSSFLDVMMSMEDNALDTAEEITRIFSNALIEDVFNNKYKKALTDWQEELSKVLQIEDDSRRESELARLRTEMQNMQRKAKEEADAIKDATGYTEAYNQKQRDQQSATVNSAQNITYEQADAIVGVGMNLAMLTEHGNQTGDLILANLVSMQNVFIGDGGMLSLISQGNQTRETMLTVMKEHFSNFNEKINRVITELQNIQ